MDWRTICDRARILEDSLLTYNDNFMVRRYRQWTGKRITAETVHRAREKYWADARAHRARHPAIRSFTI
jgi:ribosomal protein L4